MRRNIQPEIMDGCVELHRHRRALAGLSRLNACSRSPQIIWSAVRQYARQTNRSSLSLLDVATGAGDVPIALFHLARRAGVELKLSACDTSETALEFARHSAARSAADVDFFRLDALQDPLPSGFDIIASSLFLHHLQTDDAAGLLQKMAASTNGLIIVNDLRRTWAGWALAFAAGRLLTRSDVVRVDSLLSVRAAFTISEARSLAHRAGLSGATVTPVWPQRYRLIWTRQ
ncbi:MAG TPA: methyltransferase domain-containing protein [Phycisphaerae bacterium]|nr:methyltransferase domain-containing protein [Phycisphaerae bacterium]